MQFQEFRPPSKFDTFMNKYTVPILIVVIGTVLGAVLLGKVLLVLVAPAKWSLWRGLRAQDSILRR